MKYVITSDQKAYFEKYNSIIFNNLLTEEELAILRSKAALRDSSRKKAEIQKIIYSSRFVQIAVELTSRKKLRFGYDQVYELPLPASTQVQTLQEVSSIAPLVCAFTICLEGTSEQAVDKSFAPFAQKPGEVTFFLPTRAWNFELLSEREKQKFLLVAYADSRSLYLFQEQDPYVHTLKELGYVFGDRLNDRSHPVLTH